MWACETPSSYHKVATTQQQALDEVDLWKRDHRFVLLTACCLSDGVLKTAFHQLSSFIARILQRRIALSGGRLSVTDLAIHQIGEPSSAMLLRKREQVMETPLVAFPKTSESAFAAAIKRALFQVGPDGRLSRKDAQTLRQAMTATPHAMRQKAGIEPAEYFGPFESLPYEAQHAILRAIVADDRWRMLGYELGEWHTRISRSLWTLRRRLRTKSSMAEKLMREVALIVQTGPARLLYVLYEKLLIQQGQYSPRPPVAALLKLGRIDLRDLAVCYARDIPQMPAYRGFWHDAVQRNTIGVVLGIDFIATSEGYQYLESNLNCALRLQRTALYERDPFVSNLVEFATMQGYRHVIIVGNNGTGVDALMAAQYSEEAATRGLKLTLVEDAFLPLSGDAQSFALPRLDKGETLIVRIKLYRTSLDHLFQHKQASSRALEVYKRHFSDDAFHLPITRSEPVLAHVDVQEPFPNLVYKLPEHDGGKGIIFVKSLDPEHARSVLTRARHENRSRRLLARLATLFEDASGVYQPYVRAPLLEGRRLYIIRAHVLITPVGAQFLSAHRVVSGHPVPEHLPLGIVQDPRPYIVNYSVGARYEIVPPHEEREVKRAALAVAKGLSWAAAYGFQTAPS